MCGIDIIIQKREEKDGHRDDCSNENELSPFRWPPQAFEGILKRGPDSNKTLEYSNDHVQMRLLSSTLHLRGDSCVVQPLENDAFILQWNGEIYDGINVGLQENDTEKLHSLLGQYPIESIFSRIRGEYAFVIFSKLDNTLYYGRDYFGRRSLIVEASKNAIHISSVIPKDFALAGNFHEVPAKGIWKLNLFEKDFQNAQLIPWEMDGPLWCPIPRITDAIEMIDSREQTLKDTQAALIQSLKRRIENIPHIQEETNKRARLAILFSGGIDSVILTALAHQVVPLGIPVDLINVAFENSRFLKNTTKPDVTTFDVPDRISGQIAWKELTELFPRPWNFVEVNVTRSEYDEALSYVSHLMRPQDTVMDLSIAIALWFAARGKGRLYNPLSKDIEPNLDEYKSEAKVILVGMGADEQLGGYGRHRTAFEYSGHAAVIKEIQTEVDRIWSRNLGRDDRCISDNGKEARFPFLDESFVSYLSTLPVTSKCDLSLPRGQGEKILFRELAKSLGFSKQVYSLPKRAIQFGAKTAKIENNKSGKDAIN